MADDKSPSQKTHAHERAPYQHLHEYMSSIRQVVDDRNVCKICTIINKLSIIKSQPCQLQCVTNRY